MATVDHLRAAIRLADQNSGGTSIMSSERPPEKFVAWDGRQYDPPPPTGWYQASDGRWYPPTAPSANTTLLPVDDHGPSGDGKDLKAGSRALVIGAVAIVALAGIALYAGFWSGGDGDGDLDVAASESIVSTQADSGPSSVAESTTTTVRRTTTTRPRTTTTVGLGESIDNPLPMSQRFGFTYGGGPGETNFDGFLYGMLNADIKAHRQDDVTGECLFVLGSLTPVEIADGASVSSSFDTPPLYLIVDGRLIESEPNCEPSALEASGYRWTLDVESTLNTPTDFYESFLVPEGSNIEAVAVGSPANGSALFYEPTFLESAP